MSFDHDDPNLIFNWGDSDGHDHSATGRFSFRCPKCFERYVPPSAHDLYTKRQQSEQHPAKSIEGLGNPRYERWKESLEELKQHHYERWAQEHTQCPAPSAEDINKNKRDPRRDALEGSLRSLGKQHFDADDPWPV